VAFNVCNSQTIQQHRTTGKEPSRTQNKYRTGQKAIHGRDNYFSDTYKEMIETDKEIKEGNIYY
jgi:hypothetical protein